jgi:hypothetical protein
LLAWVAVIRLAQLVVVRPVLNGTELATVQAQSLALTKHLFDEQQRRADEQQRRAAAELKKQLAEHEAKYQAQLQQAQAAAGAGAAAEAKPLCIVCQATPQNCWYVHTNCSLPSWFAVIVSLQPQLRSLRAVHALRGEAGRLPRLPRWDQRAHQGFHMNTQAEWKDEECSSICSM